MVREKILIIITFYKGSIFTNVWKTEPGDEVIVRKGKSLEIVRFVK